jgi:hypothetical protein
MATILAGFLSPWLLGWISATPRPLGVDCGHPQWPDLYIFFFFFFFFFFFLLMRWFAEERDMATKGGRISPPGHWGGSRPPPVAGSIFFFFFFFFSSGKVAGEGDGCRRLFAGGGCRAAVVAASGWLWLVD